MTSTNPLGTFTTVEGVLDALNGLCDVYSEAHDYLTDKGAWASLAALAGIPAARDAVRDLLDPQPFPAWVPLEDFQFIDAVDQPWLSDLVAIGFTPQDFPVPMPPKDSEVMNYDRLTAGHTIVWQAETAVWWLTRRAVSGHYFAQWALTAGPQVAFLRTQQGRDVADALAETVAHAKRAADDILLSFPHVTDAWLSQLRTDLEGMGTRPGQGKAVLTSTYPTPGVAFS